MNVLIFSHRFWPDRGGIETIASLVAEGFVDMGHSVIVVTRTTGAASPMPGVDVIVTPSLRQLARTVSWSDTILHVHPCFRYALMHLALLRHWTVVLHTWLGGGRPNGRLSMLRRVKKIVLRTAAVYIVDPCLEVDLGRQAPVLLNGVDDRVFRKVPGVPRDLDVICVGRLVSDKGIHVLIAAAEILCLQDPGLSMTLIGDGPEAGRIGALIKEVGLEGNVRILGGLEPPAVADEMRRHRVVAVPSVWAEPFGLVAVEGMFCGCVPVVTEVGGLPNAVGQFGILVPPADASALARALRLALATKLAHESSEHLAAMRRSELVRRYAEALKILSSQTQLTLQ